jgi:predicted Zn-dependent peptidase
MNSRLNMSLREKSGYSYSVESHYTAYSDTGIFLVYYGCEKDKAGKSLNLVYKEFDKIKNSRMGSLQVSKAKKQLLGQLAISAENNEHFMLTMGKNILVYDRVDSLEEIAKKIEAVTTSDILDSANEILDKNSLSVLQFN